MLAATMLSHGARTCLPHRPFVCSWMLGSSSSGNNRPPPWTKPRMGRPHRPDPSSSSALPAVPARRRRSKPPRRGTTSNGSWYATRTSPCTSSPALIPDGRGRCCWPGGALQIWQDCPLPLCLSNLCVLEHLPIDLRPNGLLPPTIWPQFGPEKITQQRERGHLSTSNTLIQELDPFVQVPMRLAGHNACQIECSVIVTILLFQWRPLHLPFLPSVHILHKTSPTKAWRKKER